MKRGRRHRIRSLIILAALIFSTAVSLSGCPHISPPPPVSSYCNPNSATKVYSCNINFTITNLAGYSQTSGVSVIVANP